MSGWRRASARIVCLFVMLLLGFYLPVHATSASGAPHPAYEHTWRQTTTLQRTTVTATLPQANARTMQHGNQAGTTMSTVLPLSAQDQSPQVMRSTPAVQTVALPSTTDPSAAYGTSFTGISKADANGAGGADAYIELVNSQIAIFSRSGTEEYTSSLNNWFQVPSGVPVIDPVVVWDAANQRFVMSANVGYAVVLSAAAQKSALGTYCTYWFYTQKSNQGADFDKLGVSATNVYLTANLLDSNTGTQVSNELFAIATSAVENCQQNPTYQTWTGLVNPDGSLVEALVPAVMESSSSSGDDYLVNSLRFGGCRLTLWTYSNTTGSLSRVFIPTQCYSPPTLAPQKGTSMRLGTGSDNSLTQASYLNDKIIVSMPSAYTWASSTQAVTIIDWFIIRPSTHNLYMQGSFGHPGYWVFYPAAARNSLGQVLFVFNASSPNTYPAVWYVTLNTSSTVALVDGAGNYVYGKGAPWGDYNSAWLDMAGPNPNAIWITGEYASATDKWGTAFGIVTP